jgi:hypothetical protein
MRELVFQVESVAGFYVLMCIRVGIPFLVAGIVIGKYWLQ